MSEGEVPSLENLQRTQGNTFILSSHCHVGAVSNNQHDLPSTMETGILQDVAGITKSCSHFLSNWARGEEDTGMLMAGCLWCALTKHGERLSAGTWKADPTAVGSWEESLGNGTLEMCSNRRLALLGGTMPEASSGSHWLFCKQKLKGCRVQKSLALWVFKRKPASSPQTVSMGRKNNLN